MLQGKIRRYLKHGTLPQLRVFEAVSRHGNFTRAAEELHVAQPTVSVQIRKLTETVGLPLFEYVGKRVYPTAAGRELYAACQSIFNVLAGIENALSDIRGLESGSLRIAATSAARHLATRLLAEFVRAHPGVAVSLHLERRQSIVQRLADNLDDLYVLANAPDGPEVVVQRVAPNPLLVLARSDHPLAGARGIPFARFAREPLFMREPGSGTRMATERLFASHGFEPVTRMVLGSNEAIAEAVLAGLGIAVLHRHSLGSDLAGGRIVMLDVAGFPVESYVNFVYPAGKRLSIVTQAFVEFARTAAPRLISD